MNELDIFMRLFRGRTDAYGIGKGGWVKQSLHAWQYQDHLDGKGSGLGVAPLLDNGQVWFAAVDLDEPDFDAAAEIQQMLGFTTTWIERSRSGNAHVWAFFGELIDAWIPRGIMREAIAAVGKPTVEVFPKQDKLTEGMLGNYINLPYHGEDRQILTDSGEAWERSVWLDTAAARLSAPADWRKRADWLMIAPPEARVEDRAEFGTGKELHMCAEWIVANRFDNPISEGHRNVVYFNLAKQLAHYEGMGHDEAWTYLTMVRDAADSQGQEHLPDAELRRMLGNAERGGFTSTGCDDPLMQPYVHPECPIAKRI